MKFKEYYVTNNEGKSNCVIRSFCKIYNDSYNNVYDELIDISKELNCNNFNDVEVFEEYMKRRNTTAIDYGSDMQIKDLQLNNGTYAILCWDKKDFYHMVVVIDGILYDKDDSSLELYVITNYKQNVPIKIKGVDPNE